MLMLMPAGAKVWAGSAAAYLFSFIYIQVPGWVVGNETAAAI